MFCVAVASYKEECRTVVIQRLPSTPMISLNHERMSEGQKKKKTTKNPFKLLPCLFCVHVHIPHGLWSAHLHGEPRKISGYIIG